MSERQFCSRCPEEQEGWICKQKVSIGFITILEILKEFRNIETTDNSKKCNLKLQVKKNIIQHLNKLHSYNHNTINAIYGFLTLESPDRENTKCIYRGKNVNLTNTDTKEWKYQ